MFKGKGGEEKITGFIGKGISIKGKLAFEGTVRIDGEFEGEIEAKGNLLVGDGASVKADVAVDTLRVRGELRGKVIARKRVDIEPPGRLFGEVVTPVFVIGEGGFFEGQCSMGEKGKKGEKAPVDIRAYREVKTEKEKS